MTIGRKPRWLSTPAHASHWPAPVRWLRVWGTVWAYLAAVMFLLQAVVGVLLFLVDGGEGVSFGPWHSSFGYAHWRFALAVAILVCGCAASIAYLRRREAIRLLAPCAVLAFLAQTFLDPYDAMRAQFLAQRPGAYSARTGGPPTSAVGIATYAASAGSVFLAWLHLALVRDPTPSERVCRFCGYDFGGLPDSAETCPECGKSRWPPAQVSKRGLLRR